MKSPEIIFTRIHNMSEAHSEPGQTSKMECFAKIVNNFLSLTTFVKSSILDIRLGSETPLYLLVLD